MAADACVLLVLAVDHGHGVPADEGFDAALHGTFAGVVELVFGGDGVLVRRGDGRGGGHAGGLGALAEGFEEFGAKFMALSDDIVKSFHPLRDLRGKVLPCGVVHLHRHKLGAAPGCVCLAHRTEGTV